MKTLAMTVIFALTGVINAFSGNNQKEALKWNEIEQVYERYYCLNYNYSEAGTDVE